MQDEIRLIQGLIKFNGAGGKTKRVQYIVSEGRRLGFRW